MGQIRIHNLIGILIVLSFVSLIWPAVSPAALQVSFTQQSTILSIGEEGTWEVSISNPAADPDAVEKTLMITLPDDFTVTDAHGGSESTGPPHTLTWTDIDIYAGSTHTQRFVARPNCGAGDQQQIDAQITSSTGTVEIGISSDLITINIPILKVLLVDQFGNTVIDAHQGDTIIAYLTVENSGDGILVAGADITLDKDFKFASITSSTGHNLPGGYLPDTPTTWNSGPIAAHSTAEYEITSIIESCAWAAGAHTAAVTWSDGSSAPCISSPQSATISVNLIIREPRISINVTNPGPLGYCPGSETTASITISNDGDGPAEGFYLMMDNWPADWQVMPITAGITFDETSNTFSLPDVAGKDSSGNPGSLTFQFEIEPDSGTTCSITESADLLFLPLYANECGPVYGTAYYTPVVGPQTWAMQIPAKPTFTVTKTGPSSADVGDTNLVYDINVTYTGPDSALPYTVDVVDAYPGADGFVVTDADGGTDDGAGTIVWSDVTFTSANKSADYAITMDAPTDPCAGFHTYCNRSTVSSVPDDCRGCPGVINDGEACTYINDTHGNIIRSSAVTQITPAPADVCRDIQFRTCYTTDTGAPSAWTNVELDNSMSPDPTRFTLVSIDSITVDGTDYISGSPVFPLDLSFLETTAAPKPDAGVTLCVTYTYSVQNSEGDFTNTSSLSAGGGSSCGGSLTFDVAVNFSVEGSRMEVMASGTPKLINTCESRGYTIEIGGFRNLYDAKVTLDTEGDYSFQKTVSFSNVLDVAGNVIAVFEPHDNGDGTYTWDFSTHATDGDILPQGTITIEMRHSCDPSELEWSAFGVYNNKCENGSDPQARTTPVSTDAPLKVLDGEPTLHMGPAVVFTKNSYAEQKLNIVNGGSGPLYNVDVTVTLGAGLVYFSYSVPAGSNPPDAVTGNPGDHVVTFHYDQIASGDNETVNLVAKLVGCDGLTFNAVLIWCDPANSCDTVTKDSVVILPEAEVLIVKHTGDQLDLCNDQDATFTIGAENHSLVDMYNTRIVELLPPGVTYIDNTTTADHNNGYGPLTGNPVITTATVGSQQQIIWDFTSVLPQNNETPSVRAMKPDSSLTVAFEVELEDCAAAAAFAASDKQAAATALFDPPCNAGGTPPPLISPVKILTGRVFVPHILISKEGENETKGSGWQDTLVSADPDDIINWRITLTSDGDYKAKAVSIKDILPSNITYTTGSSTLDGSSLPDDWFDLAVYPDGYPIGDMDPGDTHTIVFESAVKSDGCTVNVTENETRAGYGCCTDDPMYKTVTDSVNLRTSPDLSTGGGRVDVRHHYWTACGGQVEIILTNSGGTAVNQTITDTLPSGYEVDSNTACQISATDTPSGVSHAPFTCPSPMSGGTITWDHNNIDFVAPGETIRVFFWAKTDSTGDCSSPPGSITNSAVFNFESKCGDIGSNSDTDTFTPPHPAIEITIAPTQQIVKEGDPASWTITLTNSGNWAAENLTLTDELGTGFSGPSDNQGGSWSGNMATWHPATIAAGGGTWTTTVTATVGPSVPLSLANHAHVIGKCQDQADVDTCIYVDKTDNAYVAAFSLDKSVDKAMANVGELLTYQVTAVFSNSDEFQNVKIVDVLPPWVEYVSSQSLSGYDFGSPVITGSADATGWTLTWSPVGFNGKRTFDYEITARILNNAANVSGTVLTNHVTTTFDIEFPGPATSPDFSLSKEASTTVHEPQLSLSKSIIPNSGLQAGDTVTITLVAINNGDGPAYNVDLSDLINDNNAISGTPDGVVDGNDIIVYDCSTIVEDTTPGDFSYGVSGTTPACSVNYTITGDNAIAPGDSCTFSFTVQIAPTMVTGSNYINRALTEGWSLKPTDTETGNTAYNRKTDAAATDQIVSEKVSNGKSLISTSESVTTGSHVAIGEVAEYRLSFAFPAGKTRAVVLVDELPLGLGFIPGSATLARDNLNINTANNPGNINNGTINTAMSVTLDSSNLLTPKLDLGDVDNSSGGIAHLTLILKCVVQNTSGNNAGTVLIDRIRMDWQDASGTGYNITGNTVEVKVVEPVLAIVKTATPTTVGGGDTVTFTVKLCNNATGNSAASAFDWIFTDPLPADYENPQIINVDTGMTGATVNAFFAGNTLNGTIDQLDLGECVAITYTADIIVGVDFGKTIPNTAQFMTTSLPGDHGTGDVTPGAPGTETGERIGSGSGSNDLRGSDSAQVTTSIPNITKDIITPQTWYAIGDEETFKLTLGIPTGTTSSFVVTDTLPAGLIYVDGSQLVTPPAGFDSVNNPPIFTWDAITRELKWDFGLVGKSAPADDLSITYDVKVENVLTNQDGTTLTNRALLTYGHLGNNIIGPVSQTMTVGEPDLYLIKTPQTTPVDLDAGDSLRYRVELWNNGHTTAWQMDWQDVLPLPNPGSDDGLYNITNSALTIVSGDVYQNDTTTPLSGGDLVVSTTNGPVGNNDTIALPAFSMAPGSHFYVEFDCQLMSDVVANETLTNETAVSYKSRVNGDHTTGVRDCENPPCDDDNNSVLNNYGESASHDLTVKAEIDIVKTLVGGTDKFTIGEEFAYNLRTWVIDGVSPNVEVHDDIPAGLTLESHQINTPGIGIISFSNPGYDTPSGNVLFDFGNVTNLYNNDPTDDHFDVELTVKVDNLAANQDGVTITNNAFVRWTAGTDEYSQDIDIEIIEPQLSVSKTVLPTIQAAGDLATYTVVVSHAAVSIDDAYDLAVNDILPVGLTFISSTEPNAGTGQTLEFHKASLLQGETWQFTYIVRVDTAASGTLTNDLDLEWSSIPGAAGSTHSGRNGIDCGLANPLNDYCDADKVPLTVVDTGIDIQKTVYLGHDGGASCPGGELAAGENGTPVTYCFVVTNTGSTYLDEVSLKDPLLGIDKILNTVPMAPGAVLTDHFETVIIGDQTNTATASGNPVDSHGNDLPGILNPRDHDTARVDSIGAGIPVISKSIVTPEEWYSIGDVEEFVLTLGVPSRNIANFIVTDILPPGLTYGGVYNITLPAGFHSTNNPAHFTWNLGTRELKWDFGDVRKDPPSGMLKISYDVRVENIITNQDGTILKNSATLTYDAGQIAGPVTQTMQVGEPNLYMEKTPQTTPVNRQAGDLIRYRVEVWNNGHTTAWQMEWHDVLPYLGPNNGLYNITSLALVVVAGDVDKNGTILPLVVGDLLISTTNSHNDTIALPAFSMSAGSHFYVEFDCQLMDQVVAGNILANNTAVSYVSQVTGDNTTGVRDCENPPCDDDNSAVLNNYGTTAAYDLEVEAKICIVKTILGGDDHFNIGEDFAYNLRTWVIEGVSPEVKVHDDIPVGLTLRQHRITPSAAGVISFSNPSYNTQHDNVWFDFGSVTNAVNQDRRDDYFDTELTVRVDNIPANINGVRINNQAYISWASGPDVLSAQVAIGVIEPQLEITKTVNPQIQNPGDLVTYTLMVQHACDSTAVARDLVVTDLLPVGLTFVSSVETNYGSGQNLEFRRLSLAQSGVWQFTYVARVNSGVAGVTLENKADIYWASIFGADGGVHSGRNGLGCGQGNPLNSYCGSDTAPLEVGEPALELAKTVYEGHDGGASCPGSDQVTVGLISYHHPDCPPVVIPTKITYCFTVTNTGGTFLDNITIVDSQLGITEADMTRISGTLPLAPGAAVSLYYETNTTKDIANTAEACGVAVDEHGNVIPGVQNPCDSDTAEVMVDLSIPTVNEWGMILAVFLLSILSIYFMRRRKSGVILR